MKQLTGSVPECDLVLTGPELSLKLLRSYDSNTFRMSSCCYWRPPTYTFEESDGTVQVCTDPSKIG